ncbi:helix-turn-helix transcriptional regulator [Actinocatenispora rupis]|uniref:Transcriptional regulator n=1 Tax=Actinocatenispora rupis TaxID=519421 RepID=A0A8J3NBZ7_9ACTN|nr:WYL domain-containing protein [Actinocatenispora rupis]GID13864.1 transcriptional regulator [Actinocatenispora rupis]
MRASRLISLLLLIQSRHRLTAPQLAAELGVSERTVYRDVRALSDAGIPIYAEQGGRGGYSLVDGYRTRLTGLTRAEAEALFLSGAQTPAAALGLSDALAAAQLKVLAALPGELRDVSDRVGRRYFVDAPRWFRPTEPPRYLSELAGAVWTDRVVTATYDKERGRPGAAGRPVRRRIEPYGLVLKDAVWYLAGRVGESVRTYRVDRFAEVAATEETFERDAAFDLGEFWTARAVEFERTLLAGTATVRLTAEGTRALWYAVDRVAAEDALASAGEPDEDGSVVVRLPIESVQIAHRDLLRLGTDAEVLAPPELRELVAGTARTLAERYG